MAAPHHAEPALLPDQLLPLLLRHLRRRRLDAPAEDGGRHPDHGKDKTESNTETVHEDSVARQ